MSVVNVANLLGFKVTIETESIRINLLNCRKTDKQCDDQGGDMDFFPK